MRQFTKLLLEVVFHGVLFHGVVFHGALCYAVLGSGVFLSGSALGQDFGGEDSGEANPNGSESSSDTPPPFPPVELPKGYMSPFENPRAAWTWINFKERTIVTFAHVCSFAQPIELAVCQAGGKTHESILETFATAQHLHAAALLLGADTPRIPKPTGGGQPTEATYDTATITLEWLPDIEELKKGRKAGEGEEIRIEDLIVLATTGEPMPHVDWLYIGSYFSEVPKDWRNKEDTTTVYAADYFDWGIVTTYNTPGSVFDNPLPGGASDESYYGNVDKIPPPGTLALVRFRLGDPIKREILIAPTEGFRPNGEQPQSQDGEPVPEEFQNPQDQKDAEDQKDADQKNSGSPEEPAPDGEDDRSGE